jgi:hypothetical protein
MVPNSYDLQKDPNALLARNAISPGGDLALVVPADGADLPVYAKALRVFVPFSLAEAALRVTPALAADDAATVTLKFSAGTSYEPLSVRRVWWTGTTPGLDIHAYTV